MSLPTSILLPTTTCSPVIEEIAMQLTSSDELLIICDDETDPVASHAVEFSNTQLIVAGEPTGCSGKATASATGMEAASHDRIVWTDDDFRHPPDWLIKLHEEYERFGPISELPFFVGMDPLSLLFEPIYALGGTVGMYTSNKVWGGAVMFERDDLDSDTFLRDLRQTVSDDVLLSEYLDVTPASRVRRVEIGGTIRETLERHARFTQIIYRHSPLCIAFLGIVTSILTLFCLLVPFSYGGHHDASCRWCVRQLRHSELDDALSLSSYRPPSSAHGLCARTPNFCLGRTMLPLAQ